MVKRLAFVEAPEYLYGKLFGAVVETWKTGLDFDRTNAARYGSEYHPVFSIHTFLHGWSTDLPRVQKVALLAYSGFLRFHDVHTDRVQFDQAVEAFVEHVKNVMTPADSALAGRIALNFGQEVLGPLLSLDRAMALKHTQAAASLISIATLLGPARALGDDSKPVPTALHWLEGHIVQSVIPPLERDRKTPETGSGLREGAYKVLNVLWRKLGPSYRSHIEQPLSTLMPVIGGWDRRDPRLAVRDWWAWVSFEDAGRSRTIQGAVFDLCPAGRGFHIMFTDEVQRCENLEDADGGIRVTLKGGGGMPASAPSPGVDPPMRNVKVTFRLPDGSTFSCEAWALRGRKYEVTMGVDKDFCGAVFRIDKPEDVAALKSRLGGLPPQSGMAPPPETAPAGPPAPVPAAPSAGAAGEPEPGPSSQAEAKGGDDKQQTETTRSESKQTKTVELPAPSTECYAELDAPTADRGVLKVLFTKPGPGRPTEICSITVEKQPLAILLAGVEAATRRLREADDELPSDRLPEERKMILEWSQDSLQDQVKGEAGAKRGAMARVRRLVRFQDGVGLVTNQDKETKTWMSTIPFRLRATDDVRPV